MQCNQAVIDRWSGAAPFWEKHRQAIRQMFAPVTEALIEDASIAAGHAVLDVATGPGEPALGIAPVVGPEGKSVGIDPIPGMVAAARRSAARSPFRNTKFEVAFADDLPFPADSFDAVVSRFGVMFVPSPVEAVREMLRVLKPGRKVALAVWHLPESNPFFYTFSQVIERYVDSPPLAPDAPDAFRFAASGRLRRVFDDAGAIASSERLLHFAIEASMSVEEFWALRIEMSEKLREKLATLSPEQSSEAKRDALEAIRPYSTTRGMSFPAQVLIVSGTKSRPAL
jgi:SAM-dependent methyltransferase